MSISFNAEESQLLRTLNGRSWDNSFSPDRDIDWDTSTTPSEFRTLYDVWSLLLGTRYEAELSEEQRIRFAKYQQMNLMMGTALFELCALRNLESLFRDDDDPAFQEYIVHLLKEETYHYVMFIRAIERILDSDGALRPLPERPFRMYISIVLFLLRCVPIRKLRHGTFFFLLRFIEEITLQASAASKGALSRQDSLVRKVWELHAIDESRHVVFDDLMMRNAKLPSFFERLPSRLAMPLCIGASLLINANEIWAARRLGVPVHYHELPALLRRTSAPFKRKIFSLVFSKTRATESQEQ